MGMLGLNTTTSNWAARAAGAGLLLGVCIFAVGPIAAQEPTQTIPPPWVAPDDAKKVKNPIPSNPENLAAGEQLFSDNCVLCHGDKGMGDGPGAKTIKVKPANFTDPKVQASETDGALFWKMGNGRGPMPAWKDILTDEERWKLVNYIRKLGKDTAKK
jgi:mono/diheme cytochrome c family protein